ncbi:hypothetical protein ACK31R_13580 [Aeromonas caviae]
MHYTVDQLAKDLRLVFEQHYEQLDEMGFPFFSMFPENCCQGASIMLGMLAEFFIPTCSVVLIKGSTRGFSTNYHYWLTIDDLVYDLTLDQFQPTLGNKFDQLKRPLFCGAKHPLRMHFFHKKRLSTFDAYRDFCDQYTGAEHGLRILQFLARQLTQVRDISLEE